MKRKTLMVEEGCDTWLSTRNRIPAPAVARKKTHVMKSVRSSGCQMARVMSSLLMMSTPPPVRKTRQTSIAAYLMQPKKAKGNPDEEESVKSPATISPPQRRGRRSSDDKENIPLRKERSDEKKAFSWVDSSRDDTRSLEDGGFLTPSGRGWSSLGDTSQDTSSPHCTTKNGKSSSRRRKSSDCAGLQASVGFRPCTSCEPLETYDSDDDTQFTQYSPERGDFCINRGRNQTMSPVERNDSVGVLTLLDDSRFMVDSVNASENDSTVSAPIHETSLQLHMNTPEFDDTCSDLTEMAFTFHSTDEDVVATGTGRQFSSFLGSPRKNSAVFSDAVARLPVTSDDTDSDVTRDSTDFCFTFHTESSQVHVGNDRHGEDFRFTDCDSGCSTMGTLPLSFHTY